MCLGNMISPTILGPASCHVQRLCGRMRPSCRVKQTPFATQTLPSRPPALHQRLLCRSSLQAAPNVMNMDDEKLSRTSTKAIVGQPCCGGNCGPLCPGKASVEET